MTPFRRIQIVPLLLGGLGLALCLSCNSGPMASGPDDGWQRLFDGSSTDQWRGFRQESFPAQGWVVEDGILKHRAGGGGGDIVTREQYQDFEFQCEWRVNPGANSGIIYLVSETTSATWMTGPEYQILDDHAHKNLQPDTGAGALYDLLPCSQPAVRPAGEWNHARVKIHGHKIEHWLNGVKVVEVEHLSPRWHELVAQSKFAKMEDFGRFEKGHIALQDHNDEVWFRNMKIRVFGDDD